jgi:hypothetical protein
MNDDMRRLCDCFADPETDDYGSITVAGREAIVRAVLEALPDLDGGPRYAAGEWSRKNIDAFISDMLDQAEPCADEPRMSRKEAQAETTAMRRKLLDRLADDLPK